MALALHQKEFLSRGECSAYLETLGLKIGVGALANLAANNNARKGPPFYRTGWTRVYYKRTDVELWAKRKTERIA